MPTFSERYAGAEPTSDPAPTDLRRDILRVLERFVDLRPLRTIAFRTAGRQPDARTHYSDDNVRGETWDLARQVEWPMFYEVVEAVVGGLDGRDGVAVGESLNKLFREYRTPWMLTLDGAVIAAVDAAAWGLTPGARRSGVLPKADAAGAAPSAARTTPKPDPKSPPATAPKPLPDAVILLALGLLAAAEGYAAMSDAPRGVRIWSGVFSVFFAIAATAVAVQIVVAHRGDAAFAARMNRRLKVAVAASAAAAVIVGGTLQLRPGSVGADQPRESPAALASAMFPTRSAVEAPRTLTLAQRNAIAAFARSHGRHTVFVLSADGTEMLIYADSLADAFEAGGWAVPGRRNDETRAVTHRLGALMPNEPTVAVAPDDGLGAAVKLALENVGLHPMSWTRSLGPANSEVNVWIGRVP